MILAKVESEVPHPNRWKGAILCYVPIRRSVPVRTLVVPAVYPSCYLSSNEVSFQSTHGWGVHAHVFKRVCASRRSDAASIVHRLQGIDTAKSAKAAPSYLIQCHSVPDAWIGPRCTRPLKSPNSVSHRSRCLPLSRRLGIGYRWSVGNTGLVCWSSRAGVATE